MDIFNLVNKAKLVRKFLVYLFLFSTCFGRLCAHHQEKQLYLCDSWYFYSVWMTVWYEPLISDSHPHRVTSTKCCINRAVSLYDGHIVARNT
jgi:hypothetical protein